MLNVVNLSVIKMSVKIQTAVMMSVIMTNAVVQVNNKIKVFWQITK
jgi:hypothetical protein